MIQNGLIEELIKLDRLSKEQAGKYPLKRFLFPNLEFLLTNTRQIVGIAGLRGTGKTILLRQLNYPSFRSVNIFYLAVIQIYR